MFSDGGLLQGLVAGIVVFLLAGALIHRRGAKRRAVGHFAGREPLSPDAFAQRHFPRGQGAVAARLSPILARHLDIDLSRLHPDDRLVDDLRMDELDSLATVEFLREVEKELDVEIPPDVAEGMRTFRDVVEFVSGRKNIGC